MENLNYVYDSDVNNIVVEATEEYFLNENIIDKPEKIIPFYNDTTFHLDRELNKVQNPEIYKPSLGDILMQNSKRKIWVKWRANKKRYEVGFHWEGYNTPFRFYSWNLGNHKTIPFTEENKSFAEEYRNYIYGLMTPDLKTGVIKFNPTKLTGIRKSKNSLDNYFDDIFIKEYKTRVKTKDLSGEYVGLLQGYFKNHVQPVLGEYSLFEIDSMAVKDFYLKVSEKPISKAQIENIMDLLHLIMKQASEDLDGLDYPKFPKYKTKKNKKRDKVKWLSEDEQDLVLSFVEDNHKPISTVYLYYGLRSQEVINLKRNDLQVITDKMNHKYPTLYVKTLKGGVDRKLRLDDSVYQMIKDLSPAICGNLFHYKGKPYNRKTLYKIIRRALDKAGFKDISPKDSSRHSRASQLGSRGASSFEIQYQLGHADVRTSEAYTHISSDTEGRYLRRQNHDGEQMVNTFSG